MVDAVDDLLAGDVRLQGDGVAVGQDTIKALLVLLFTGLDVALLPEDRVNAAGIDVHAVVLLFAAFAGLLIWLGHRNEDGEAEDDEDGLHF